MIQLRAHVLPIKRTAKKAKNKITQVIHLMSFYEKS